jgi:hypothetical protein
VKVGVITVILQTMPFEHALNYLAGLGVQTVEIGVGAYSGIPVENAGDLARGATPSVDVWVCDAN